MWRTDRGQACGGIRLWQYNEMESYLRDGLRLALGMGAKSAVRPSFGESSYSNLLLDRFAQTCIRDAFMSVAPPV